MPNVQQSVIIDCSAREIFAAVADPEIQMRYDDEIRSCEKVTAGAIGKGTRYRYHLDLPGGIKETLDVQQDVFTKPKHCSGRFIKGPLKGEWSYTYSERKDGTHVVYEMDYELTGLLRFAGGLLSRQYAEGIRDNMKRLKAYIEAGKGPKAK